MVQDSTNSQHHMQMLPSTSRRPSRSTVKLNALVAPLVHASYPARSLCDACAGGLCRYSPDVRGTDRWIAWVAHTHTAAVGVLAGVVAGLGIRALVVQDKRVHTGRYEGAQSWLACTDF